MSSSHSSNDRSFHSFAGGVSYSSGSSSSDQCEDHDNHIVNSSSDYSQVLVSQLFTEEGFNETQMCRGHVQHGKFIFNIDSSAYIVPSDVLQRIHSSENFILQHQIIV